MALREILETAIKKNASDVLIVTNSPIMLRINRDVIPLNDKKLSVEECQALLYSILDDKKIKTLEETKELNTSYPIGELGNFRVNLHYQRGALGGAFRFLPAEILNFKKLGLPAVLEEFCQLPYGLVLVTGPTSHGKTTTQAAMVEYINQNFNKHIITIEDPIEYIFKNKKCVIEQRQVGVDTHSFSIALKEALRQNPDVILLGEMRDLETVSTAVTAAETGHLIISTLHTNDSVQAINRIVDVFPAEQQSQIRTQLSLSLQAVIAQRLIPRADNKGLALAVEVLRANTAVRNVIRNARLPDLYSAIQLGRKEGMITMDQSLRNLYEKQIITYQDVLENATRPEDFKRGR